jgi:hypothetical protein
MDKWELSWGFTDIWQLSICCDSCGSVHHIAESEDRNPTILDLISKKVKE